MSRAAGNARLAAVGADPDLADPVNPADSADPADLAH